MDINLPEADVIVTYILIAILVLGALVQYRFTMGIRKELSAEKSIDDKIRLIDKVNSIIEFHFKTNMAYKYERDILIKRSLKDTNLIEEDIEATIISIATSIFMKLTINEKSMIKRVYGFKEETELMEHIVRETRNRIVEFIINSKK